MNYLFLFTIGPVQSFIKQARKTRDLYAGSQILSDLVKTGIEACQAAAQAQGAAWEIKFPHFDPNDTVASLPNRFIAKLTYSETPKDAQLRALAGNEKNGAEFAVRKRLREIAQEALDSCNLIPADGFWEQIDNHLDIHWAFQPMENGKYKEAYLALERLVGSIKNVRPFAQYTYQSRLDFGERGRKCSLDGENNALYFRKRQNAAGNWETPAMIRHNDLNANCDLTDKLDSSEWGEGEALSGISTVKRFYRRKDHNFESYPSTSAVALQRSIEVFPAEVENIMVVFGKENLAKLLQQFETLNIDLTKTDWGRWNDQFFYEENITPKNIPNPQQLKLTKERHAQLRQAGFKFDKYYAVLAFDGDHMGKWLSGDNLQPGTDLEAFHKALSGKLSLFGREAQKIVDDNSRGKTVYAGGDDYLGFLNLDDLFKTVRNLRQQFHQFVNKELTGKLTGTQLTFSAGIAIAHYKEPLGMVVQKARDMEEAAKKQGDRNAFGLAVVKASGEIQQTVYKWDKEVDSPDGCSNWDALEKVFNALKDGIYSNKFISNLSLECYNLAGLKLDDFGTVSSKAMECEIERLVSRAKTDIEASLDIVSNVKDLFTNRRLGASGNRAENFVHGLHIADFLHRKLS